MSLEVLSQAPNMQLILKNKPGNSHLLRMVHKLHNMEKWQGMLWRDNVKFPEVLQLSTV